MTFLQSFLRPTYRASELKSEGSYIIKWESVNFPEWFIYVGIIFLVIGVLLLWKRKSIIQLLQGIPVLQKQWFWTTWASIFLFLGVITTVNTVQNPPMTQWKVTSDGLDLVFPQSKHFISWDNLVDARWDTSKLSLDNSPLVLIDKNGKKLWLAVNWLLKRDKIRFINELRKRDPIAFQSAIEGKSLDD